MNTAIAAVHLPAAGRDNRHSPANKSCPNWNKRVDVPHPAPVNRWFTEINRPHRRGIGIVGHRKKASNAVLLTALLLISACTDSSVPTQPLSPSSPPASPAPTSTIDPRAQAAVTAYRMFNDTANEAQAHPVGHGEKWPRGADFTTTSFDPLRAQFTEYIWLLKEQGLEYRGIPDVPHITVKSIRLNAKPWPAVFLTDCQTGGDGWGVYVIKTGKKAPAADNGKVPPPYLTTAKVIYFEGHWGVQSTSTDKSRTCTA
jgi:hypothetical protein